VEIKNSVLLGYIYLTCYPDKFVPVILIVTFFEISTVCFTIRVFCLRRFMFETYRGADKSLARPGSKQARKHVRDARDFSNIETRAVTKLFFFPCKAPNEIQAILTETLACFLPGRAKDLSTPLYTVAY